MLVTESNKTDCNPKISEIKKEITTDHDHDHDHDKYITTQKFNKLTSVKSLLQDSNENKDFDNKLKNVTSK